MTKSPQALVKKALKQAENRVQTTRETLRRNTLAYIGMHGVAYERAQEQIAKIQENRSEFFEELVAKGEEVETRAAEMFKGVKSKADNAFDDGKEKLWDMTPGAVVNRAEELEAELEKVKAKLAELTKTSKKTVKTTAKKATKKAAPKKPAAKAKPSKPAPLKAKAADVKAPESKTPETKPTAPKTDAAPVAKSAPTKPAKKEEPRHIPYFNDVKRYDPFASEDVVRKIVNHCGIALRSVDARNVACTDEAERNRVRDSWLKKKLELSGTDAELDKQVQNICSIMQRDNHKNRVTFYYLAAKAARKLDSI
ncbi:MAG: DUF2853 family protein [Alphaproteobacteria bacterium]